MHHADLKATFLEATREPALHEMMVGYKGKVSSEAKQAAYELAAALGACRLFGVTLPEEHDGMLPLTVAVAAFEVLATRVLGWIEESVQLGERFDCSVAGEEMMEVCCAPLEQRMEAWGVHVAVGEVRDDADERIARVGQTLYEQTQVLLDSARMTVEGKRAGCAICLPVCSVL